MREWLNDPSNGLISGKKVGGFDLSMKYMPYDLLAYKEIKKDKSATQEVLDSVAELYDNSYTFILSIGSDESAGENFDVMHLGVYDEDAYNQRIRNLNFHLDKYISLETGKSTYKPVLTRLENVYGLSKARMVYIVFAPDSEEEDLLVANELDIKFNDDIFNTGIHHFKFNKSDIVAMPKLKIEN